MASAIRGKQGQTFRVFQWRIATEKRHLKRKWKAHIRLETYKSQDRVAMDVPRRQPVKL